MSKVILLRGRPCTGKTTISDIVSREFSIPILRKDDFYDALCNNLNTHSERNEILYSVMHSVIKTNLINNVDLIIDTTYYGEFYTNFVNLVERYNGKLFSFLCICSDTKEWSKRIEKRKIMPLPNQQITDLEAIKKHYGTLQAEIYQGEYLLDSINPTTILMDQIRKVIILQ